MLYTDVKVCVYVCMWSYSLSGFHLSQAVYCCCCLSAGHFVMDGSLEYLHDNIDLKSPTAWDLVRCQFIWGISLQVSKRENIQNFNIFLKEGNLWSLLSVHSLIKKLLKKAPTLLPGGLICLLFWLMSEIHSISQNSQITFCVAVCNVSSIVSRIYFKKNVPDWRICCPYYHHTSCGHF